MQDDKSKNMKSHLIDTSDAFFHAVQAVCNVFFGSSDDGGASDDEGASESASASCSVGANVSYISVYVQLVILAETLWELL